jgi:hypothetical protein
VRNRADGVSAELMAALSASLVRLTHPSNRV